MVFGNSSGIKLGQSKSMLLFQYCAKYNYAKQKKNVEINIKTETEATDRDTGMDVWLVKNIILKKRTLKLQKK